MGVRSCCKNTQTQGTEVGTFCVSLFSARSSRTQKLLSHTPCIYSTSAFVEKLAPSVYYFLLLCTEKFTHSVYLLYLSLPGEVSTFRVHFTLPRPALRSLHTVYLLHLNHRGEVSTFRCGFTLPRPALRSLNIPLSVHLLHLQLLWRSWHLRVYLLCLGLH